MSDPQKFRKKPVVIEAMRLEAGSREDAAFWIGESFDGWQTCLPGHAELLRIRTLEGVMEASDGDWIIKGVAGEFYPCKPDIFATTYESVADGTTPTEPAANGLEPGEIVAVPADLRNDPDGVQWECYFAGYFAGYWLPVQADDTARRICRPITEEGQS